MPYFQDKMMHFPQWVDLKGQDTVPDTVHHVVCMVDAKNDRMWIRIKPQERIQVAIFWFRVAVMSEVFTVHSFPPSHSSVFC